MVAEAIRPVREALIDVRLGGFFGPCSLVFRTSSLSSMVTLIAICRATYEDQGGLSSECALRKCSKTPLWLWKT
jgi:hypothetical protein